MIIMQVINITNNSSKPIFKGWCRDVYKKADGVVKVVHRNNTSVYRNEGWWKYFCQFVDKFFEELKHVNVYDWGCSNGSEPYTFIMQMFSDFPETAKKFTPVYAKDYDTVAIEMAKKQVLPLDLWEIYLVSELTNGQQTEFFTNLPDCYKNMWFKSKEDVKMYYADSNNKNELSQLFNAKLNEKYSKYIDYEVSDILTDYDKIKPLESIVILRNFLPYMEVVDVYKLIENICKQMSDKCMLSFGSFDLGEIPEIGRYARQFGFKESNIEGVYYKGDFKQDSYNAYYFE